VLRVSIHAGPLGGISRFNRLDWVEIGYKRLAEEADYKVVLFEVGCGVRDQVILHKYPRWSASVWDLAARAIAAAFSPDPKNPKEEVQPIDDVSEEVAFADCVSAVIQHIPNAGNAIRQLGAIEIVGDDFERGFYGATVEEEMMPTLRPAPFFFAPRFLRPSELILRGILQGLTGNSTQLPTRPSLLKIEPEIIEDERYALTERIPEPARSGFRRWLLRRKKHPEEKPYDARASAVPYELFYEFLKKAV
jgi:hypothetical protein